MKTLKSIAVKHGLIVGAVLLALAALIAYIAFSDQWRLPAVAENEQESEQTAAENPPPEKLSSKILSKFKAKEINCLAQNIYFEARGSNLADKAAVADVVLNRTQDRRYPATVCSVISQGVITGRTDCQFSWKCDSRSNVPLASDSWDDAKTIAYNMYVHGKFRGISEGATHYHATYVKPYWAKSLRMVGRIGSHVYYRWE